MAPDSEHFLDRCSGAAPAIVHLPGHADHRPSYPFQHLEKRYFDVGNLGFGAWRGFGGVVGMCVCNDRRWPETYRVLGLQGVELVMFGYNTPSHVPWMPVYDHLTGFHNRLVMHERDVLSRPRPQQSRPQACCGGLRIGKAAPERLYRGLARVCARPFMAVLRTVVDEQQQAHARPAVGE